MSISEVQRKTIEVNLVGGIAPALIADGMGLTLDEVLGEIDRLVEQWKRERVAYDEGVNLRRLDVAVGSIWEKVKTGDSGAIQTLMKLIDRAGDKILAEARQETRQQYLEYYDTDTGPKPKADQLEDSALTGGYLDNYLSLRAAGLSGERAYFAAWFNAHPDVRHPKTVRAVARFLGRSHTVVYKWKFQDWFTDLGLNRWREQLFLQHLATVDRMTISEAEALTGPAGVQARRLFYEIGLPVLGQAGPGGQGLGAGVQVNLQSNTQVNIEQGATKFDSHLAGLIASRRALPGAGGPANRLDPGSGGQRAAGVPGGAAA